MYVTVFTPTYNRAYRLKSLYNSLCQQTSKNFEWVIVDDGSTDDTECLVSSFITSKVINIRYFKQQNGGKHRAVNRGVKEAKGELFYIVDSDDILPEQAIERIVFHYNNIRNDLKYAGVCGLKCDFEGNKVGGGENFGIISCTSLDFRNRLKIRGDMAEVIRTSVMKEFPFPEFVGEKFCPEDVLFNRIATKYKLLYFYENTYMCEYLNDGLTATITKIRMNSPMSTTTCYVELFNYDIPFWRKVKASINYWRFAYCLGNRFSQRPKEIRWGVILRPVGYIFHLLDKYKL
jgi:glycosyltransferase involved in cell wall biosynthesis